MLVFEEEMGKGDWILLVSIRTNSLNSYIILLKNKPLTGDFPGCPIVKTSPSDAEGEGSVPGWGAETPHASQPKKPKHIKQEQYCNKFNKDFLKNGPHQKKKKKTHKTLEIKPLGKKSFLLKVLRICGI